MPWRTVDGSEVAPRGGLELEVLTAGVSEHRRFPDAVLTLSKAYALAAATDAARGVRDAVGFFQTVRAALVKAESVGGASDAERSFAV